MGREVRRVAPNWEHPKDKDGNYLYLNEGKDYPEKEFLDMAAEKGLQAAIDYYGCPDVKDYMPRWTAEEATHYQMYENVSKGTPISPVCASPEELARWLANNKANAGAGSSATYEQWLRVCNGGYAPSMALIGGKLMSGVEALSLLEKEGKEG